MSKKHYASNCIRITKKICNPEVIEMIEILAKQWLISECEVCLRIINERVIKEKEKKKEIAEIRQYNNRTNN